MSKQEFSIPKLAIQLQSEADAYLLLEELRWGGAPDTCPQCGGMDRCYFLQPKDGSTGRKTRTGANTQRRVFKCGHCRKQFSVLTGTIFHGTKISIRTWLLVIFEVCSSKNSVSAWEISRKYEITNETAWHMLHRIREAMNPPYTGFNECFANGVPPNQAAVLSAVQRPAAAAQLGEPSGPPAWASIPSWSLIGTEDHAVPPALQEQMSNRAGAHISFVKAGHLSLITRPKAVVEIINQAVHATS